MRLSLLALLVPVLVGCTEAEQASVPIYTVQSQPLVIEIPGFGELDATQAQLINSPGRQPMVIDWIAEENSLVKKGDLVVRFDSERLSLESREEELEMLLIDQDIEAKHAEKVEQKTALQSDKALIGKEFEFVDAFAIDDLRLYSKLEIIDTLSNRDYLGAKDAFIEWKTDSIGERIQSSVDVLDIRKGGHAKKFERHTQALNSLEVRAPYDGLLVYQKNWRGEKASVGKTIFSGDVIAKIPNLSQMQAVIHVLDKDAIGLSAGQKATVTLESAPDLIINGQVKSVSGFSRTIQRGNPTKYFDVIVSLDTNQQQLKPGNKVSAKITVKDAGQTLLIPLQAIFTDQSSNYIYVKQGRKFEKRTIETGDKNLHFIEVKSGLAEGEQIALSLPEGQI